MPLVALVTGLALLQFVIFAMLVGWARGKYGVAAPATTGDPIFERYYRVPLEADLLPMVISAHQFSGYLPALDVVDRLIADYPHLIGFNVTFFPQHWLGLQGMPRRVSTYDAAFGWDAWNLVSTIGAFVLAAGIALYFANLAWSWRWGAASGPDPWAADSLEWATASPPPVFNFRDPPTVGSLSPLWDDAPAELDGESAQAVQVIGRPWRDRREIIRTSTLDGRPEQIVALGDVVITSPQGRAPAAHPPVARATGPPSAPLSAPPRWSGS